MHYSRAFLIVKFEYIDCFDRFFKLFERGDDGFFDEID
ncbi:hypothetical protein IMCC3088_1600 [Aequoribacter fuscus]|uniref:Uncharacterized protein n=1 Tax=Aequoribacter fuscus TaxID=2518989 RepID=F3L233_9GAMM|nr:hypothetical protein IMCC3088_1600 [Aequoribacter fuscus]